MFRQLQAYQLLNFPVQIWQLFVSFENDKQAPPALVIASPDGVGARQSPDFVSDEIASLSLSASLAMTQAKPVFARGERWCDNENCKFEFVARRARYTRFAALHVSIKLSFRSVSSRKRKIERVRARERCFVIFEFICGKSSVFRNM